MTITTTATLSMKGDRWIRLSAIAMMVIVSCASATLSWHGLSHLAVISGIPADIAWLLPLAIDGSLILGSIETVHAVLTGRNPYYGWILTSVGVTLSIYGNITSASASGFQSSLVHSIAPCVLFLSVEALVRVIKFRITATKLAAEQERRHQEREAKRREKEQQKVSVSTPARKTGKASRAPVAKQGSAGGSSRIADTDEEVSLYRNIMESLPADASKASRIETVLREHPEARSGHIALALGQDIKAVNTTIVRVRERVSKEQKEASAFTEIVKDFAPVGE